MQNEALLDPSGAAEGSRSDFVPGFAYQGFVPTFQAVKVGIIVLKNIIQDGPTPAILLKAVHWAELS